MSVAAEKTVPEAKLPPAPVDVPKSQEVREDRWVALLLALGAGLFALLLLWEPLSSLLHWR
jgi:hypothetical protein